MRIYGSVLFVDARGEPQTVVATATPRGVTPATVISLHDKWVCVGKLTVGTMLVAWESVRSLSGWAPVPAEDR